MIEKLKNMLDELFSTTVDPVDLTLSMNELTSDLGYNPEQEPDSEFVASPLKVVSPQSTKEVSKTS